MSRRFTTNVWYTDTAGNQTFYEMGQQVPDGLPVGDHCWREVNDEYLADTEGRVTTDHPDPNNPFDTDVSGMDQVLDGLAEDPDDPPARRRLVPPPTAGPGASKDAWRDYWQATTGQAAPRAHTRDDLIAGLRDRGIPVGV